MRHFAQRKTSSHIEISIETSPRERVVWMVMRGSRMKKKPSNGQSKRSKNSPAQQQTEKKSISEVSSTKLAAVAGGLRIAAFTI
jgi:hypothetical protein